MDEPNHGLSMLYLLGVCLYDRHIMRPWVTVMWSHVLMHAASQSPWDGILLGKAAHDHLGYTLVIPTTQIYPQYNHSGEIVIT